MKPIGRLRQSLSRSDCTQLGIGPMSVNCVDAVIQVSNERRVPLMLIASRRQVECSALGGGYVNGWTTETFARYVRKRDTGGYVLLCRDHGGPWQNYPEVREKMSCPQAMNSAKQSLEVDLTSGFDLLHLDPSVPPADGAEARPVVNMLLELYDFVFDVTRRLNRPVLLEVGTEEQSGGLNTPEQLADFLDNLWKFCTKRQYDMPVFVVAQTGTLVREMRNVGQFASGPDGNGLAAAAKRVRELVGVASDYGVWIKEHNGDYLSDQVLGMRPAIGIGATNIAPEFGVAETKFWLRVCESFDLKREAEAFLQLAYNSRKWEKWMMPDTVATDRDKGIIAGHYVFATPEFKEILAHIEAACRRHHFDLHRALQGYLKAEIVRMASQLGLCPT